MIKSNELEIDFSTLYYFLPSVNDRSEEINQYLKNVTISCVDIEKEEFDKWTSQEFDPSQLDLYGNQNKIMNKNICRISNSNIVRNGDCFLSRHEEGISVN